MVEVDVQILGGVAVTVFLALLFFGVVVLWDVALALRSVGDKIDKLEDNIDDDLKDIGYALDGISGAHNGGTQVHLSGGGTISPGSPTHESHRPNPSQESTASRDVSQETGPRDAPGVGRHDDGNSHARTAHAGTAHQRRRPPRGRAATSRAGETAARRPADEASSRTSTDEASSRDHADGPEAMAATEQSDGEDEPTVEELDESTAVRQETSDATAEHLRADRNRGRFVTSPDVTPWYAMAADQEAIADARSPIAGALESGSVGRHDGDGFDSGRDETEHESEEPIAAGPVDESEEEPIAAGPVDESDEEPVVAGGTVETDSQDDQPSQMESTSDGESTDVLGDVTLEELRNLDESDGVDADDVEELLAILLEELGREVIVERVLDDRGGSLSRRVRSIGRLEKPRTRRRQRPPILTHLTNRPMGRIETVLMVLTPSAERMEPTTPQKRRVKTSPRQRPGTLRKRVRRTQTSYRPTTVTPSQRRRLTMSRLLRQT